MKYNSIMNFNALNRSLSKAGPEITLKILDLEAEVTEKIHGENFRVGVTEDGRTFVGQRNGTFYTPEEHPNWNRMTPETQETVQHLLDLAEAYQFSRGGAVCYYGELCGNDVQKGFTFDWDGLTVVYFDVREGEDYLSPIKAREWFGIQCVPYVPIYHDKWTVRDALSIDVETLPSILSNEDYIEGVVIKPNDIEALANLWKFDARFIIKHKSDKYSEQSKMKDRTPKVVYDSPFTDFVTEARIDHAIQVIEEKEPGTIKNEMADMRFIIYEVLADIEREENDGNPLERKDRSSVNKATPRVYQQMINAQVKEALGLS